MGKSPDEVINEVMRNILTENKTLWLLNDEENTFQHVVGCLVLVCNHTAYQAEQCALIAHRKGKCDVKVGTLVELRPMLEALIANGLTVEIK